MEDKKNVPETERTVFSVLKDVSEKEINEVTKDYNKVIDELDKHLTKASDLISGLNAQSRATALEDVMNYFIATTRCSPLTIIGLLGKLLTRISILPEMVELNQFKDVKKEKGYIG